MTAVGQSRSIRCRKYSVQTHFELKHTRTCTSFYFHTSREVESVLLTKMFTKERRLTINSHERTQCELLSVFRGTVTVQVMLNREDRVVSVQQPDGSVTIDHTDGTRITTHLQGTLKSTLTSTPRNAASRFKARSMRTNGEEGRGADRERSVPAKERVVMVERAGCATVVLYPQRRTMHVFLADGTALSANNSGVYEVRRLLALTSQPHDNRLWF